MARKGTPTLGHWALTAVAFAIVDLAQSDAGVVPDFVLDECSRNHRRTGGQPSSDLGIGGVASDSFRYARAQRKTIGLRHGVGKRSGRALIQRKLVRSSATSSTLQALHS